MAKVCDGLDGLDLQEYCSVGRSFRAVRRFDKGALVLQDTPLIEWAADFSTHAPDDVAVAAFTQLAQRFSIPRFLAAVAHMYLICCDSEMQQLVLSMHSPSLPLEEGTAQLFRFCEALEKKALGPLMPYVCKGKFQQMAVEKGNGGGDLFTPDGRAALLTSNVGIDAENREDGLAMVSPIRPSPLNGESYSRSECFLSRIERTTSSETALRAASIAKAIMAAKVNSHRAPNGNWRLYPIASKLAHSCEPNLVYLSVSHSFVALRDIFVGQLLSFSYVAEDLLPRATLRQQRIWRSHCFWCLCDRCEGADVCGTVGCPRCVDGHVCRRTSRLLRSDADLFPEMAWSCDKCAAQLSDAAMEPTMRSVIEVERRMETLERQSLSYRRMHALFVELTEQRMKRHWTYLRLLQLMVKYFSVMASQSTELLLERAIATACGWTWQLLNALQHAGFGVDRTLTSTVGSNNVPSRLKGQGGVEFPPLVCCHAVISCLRCCGATQIGWVNRFARALAEWLLPLANAMYGEGDARLLLLHQAVNSSPKGCYEAEAAEPRLRLSYLLELLPETLQEPTLLMEPWRHLVQ